MNIQPSEWAMAKARELVEMDHGAGMEPNGTIVRMYASALDSAMADGRRECAKITKESSGPDDYDLLEAIKKLSAVWEHSLEIGQWPPQEVVDDVNCQVHEAISRATITTPLPGRTARRELNMASSISVNAHVMKDTIPTLETVAPSEGILREYYRFCVDAGNGTCLVMFLEREHLAPICAAFAQTLATPPQTYEPPVTLDDSQKGA